MAYQYKHPHFAIAADVAVFTLLEGELNLLLIRRRSEPFQGAWALPGGFLRPDESLDECATRELQEETGVSGFFLEQLYTFGAVDRDPRERVISVAYYALVPGEGLALAAKTDADAVAWFPADRLPPDLAFDHAAIIATARQRLAAKIDYSTLAFQFLPAEFTLPELQRVFEAVKGEPLDKRNFRKFILGLGYLKPTDRERRGGVHRPAKLYRANVGKRLEYFR